MQLTEYLAEIFLITAILAHFQRTVQLFGGV